MRLTHWLGNTWLPRTLAASEWSLFDRNLKARPFNYLFQSGLATVSLLLILLVEDVVFRAAIVAAVASSAFTVFVFPHSLAATSRKVIGGHGVAVISGAILSAILALPAVEGTAQHSRLVTDVAAALAAGLATITMVATELSTHLPREPPWGWSSPPGTGRPSSLSCRAR